MGFSSLAAARRCPVFTCVVAVAFTSFTILSETTALLLFPDSSVLRKD